MSLFEIVLLAIIIYFMVYAVMDRICKCIEFCTYMREGITYTDEEDEEEDEEEE